MLWKLAPKNSYGFLAGSTGVVCPSCGAKLRIVQRRAALVTGLLWILAIAAAEAARRAGAPADAMTLFAVLATTLLVFGLGSLRRRLAVLVLREGIDSVDFPLERLKRQLSGEDRPTRETDLEAGVDSIESWVCATCGEPTPVDCPSCVHCGRSQFSR